MGVAQPRLTVLVVDAEALLRWSIAEILRRAGHAVIEASSAAETRDAMRRTLDQIDVVLLDYRLSDSDDLRLLEEVRNGLPQSAVVLMTAFGAPEMTQEALDRGAHRMVSKPFDMHVIEAVVTDAYRSFRFHQAIETATPPVA